MANSSIDFVNDGYYPSEPVKQEQGDYAKTVFLWYVRLPQPLHPSEFFPSYIQLFEVKIRLNSSGEITLNSFGEIKLTGGCPVWLLQSMRYSSDNALEQPGGHPPVTRRSCGLLYLLFSC